MFELSLNSQQSGFIPTSPYNNLGLSDYQDPVFAVNPANSSQLPVPFIDTVFQAINASEYILSGLSGNSQRDYIMGTAFGLYNQESANQILTAWARNNFTNTPHIELVFGQNFNGAYAKDNNTIYLSGEFLGANKDNIEAVTGVLVEEVGHYLDSQINVQDAAGDEGDIFSRLVRGQSISEGELLGLKNEDDTGIIFINNQPISIEQQNFYGGWWSDTFNGTNSNDVMYGNDGNDYIYGNGGNDYIYGGGNDDYLWGGNNNDYLWGENGADELRGDDGNDELRGGGNDDKLWGGNQDDKLWGEDGNDQLVGDSGNDEVNGGNGDDKVWGSGGDDKLWGERGNDQLTGDDGNDILNGYGFDNYERDTLSGGGGSDSFILSDSNNVYYSKNGSSDYALITDFNRYEDVIHLKQISLDASNSTQAWGYRLVTVGSNTEIRLNSGDTIAVLQGVSGLSLTGQGFVFEGAYELKRSLITNLYQDVLGRSPDAGGLQGWIDALGRNFTLPQIRNAFGHSEEAKGKVSGIYRAVLGREPDVGGLQGYLDALGRDWSLAQARFSIGHSEEAKGKISGIYRAVLGREPDVGGLQGYLDALGRDWSLAQARFSIGHSEEAKGKISGIYRAVLGREPDAGGLQSYLDALGRDWSLAQARFSIGHSEEAKGKVSGIYRDVLGREPDVGGLQGYLDALGRDWSLAQARFSIGHSEEAKGKVSGIYRDVLGREPDTGGLQGYLDALGRDWSLAQVRSSIINSDVRLITFNNGQGKLTFTANDFVGTVDPNDFYRFTLNQRSNFNLTLDGLSEDANVELLNSSGGSITTSNYWGTTPDSITRTLDAGIYYIRVYQGRGAANTNYKLDVTADLNWAATDGILPPKSISLERTDSNGYGSPQKIDPTKPTWVVIHGWNGASNLGETMGLANALGLDGSQVLTLDWHELAKDPVNVGNAASWIQRVGTWAAKKLNDWGFTSSNINLAGHSLGSYVAYEIAKHTPGGVNRLVALDPAQEIPGGYITSQIKFKDNAKYSIAFYGSAAGSDPRGVTADATFSMGFGDGINPDKNHGRVTNLFANIVRLSRTDDRVRRFFGLENLNSNSYHPWVDNKFNDRGKYYGDAVVLPDPKDYLYEGRIEARFDGGNSFLKSLKYYDREHNKDEELFW
jgi:Ca2+-binding RTX toxin-like protein/pimeloyl-ACP methyl ester carboxylesterase